MIAVVKNAGGTNLKSVCQALDRMNATYTVTGDPKVIQQADKVILPGVGAAAHAMQKLQNDNLISVLRELTQPVLGICLGMQILFRHSEEGNTPCLGMIGGDVKKLESTNSRIRIPHMGWNHLDVFDREYPLCKDLPEVPYFYFVHSFAAELGPWVKASVTYGQAVPAIIQHRNFFGCQFHPEKSSKAGEVFLRNFTELKEIP